jgi:two-component system, chemotaxis family, sensor histidine kinase and response regulator PixL
MAISAQEQQVRLQFLEEAQDYVDQIETGLLGVGSGEVKGKQLDAVMRAAHSIKGGAAMMSYPVLAQIGHRLEDSLKVLRYGQKSDEVDDRLEKELLTVVDRLRRVLNDYRQGLEISATWLATEVSPLLENLLNRLGEPQAGDDGFFSGEDEEEDDIVSYLFETEVDAALEHLEGILADPAHPSLHSELEITTETLNGLAEMIELPAMALLCQDIAQKLVTYPDRYFTIAEMAAAAWRRSQSLVQINQRDDLPTAIEAIEGVEVAVVYAANLSNSLSEDLALVDTLVPVTAADELELVALNIEPIAEPLIEFIDEESGDLDFLTNLVGDDLSGDLLSGSFDDLHFGDLSNSDNTTTITDLFEQNLDNSATTDLQPGEIEELFSIDELSELSVAEPTIIDTPADLADSGSLPLDAVPLDLTLVNEGALTETSPLIAETGLDWDLMPSDIDVNDFFGDIAAAAVLPTALSAITTPLVVLPPTIADEPRSSPIFTPESLDNTPIAPEQTIRVGVERLAEIGDLFGELNISRSGLSMQVSSMRSLLGELLEKVAKLELASVELRSAYDRISVDVSADKANGVTGNAFIDDIDATLSGIGDASTILTNDFDRLEMDRYGDFHLLSQAVIESVVQIQEKVSDIEIQLNDTELVTRDINRTSQQMQTRFTTVRMLPLSEIVGRFPRAVREMSIEHGKEVNLKIKGGNLSIERHTIDVLKDPLMHLLRNCFDHGIEPTAERIAAGKPAAGLIEINATYRGNQIVITIQDDGKGIDLDKIKAKALKMGIDDELLASSSKDDLLDLIFEPGFSTAEKVTDLSGRGVGMDVVRTNLHAANGNIHIDTTTGKGSTFTITVPFTMSLMKVMIAESNKMLLAFPVNGVEEMLLADPSKITEADGRRQFTWQDANVQLVNLQNCFQTNTTLRSPILSGQPKIDQPAVLVVNDADRFFGLEIDRFWHEQEVTVRQPQGFLQMPNGISGCGVLGDGRVIPLVDPLALVRWLDNANNDIQLPAQPTAVPFDNQDLIMVVDDSINVRRFVAMTLERNGYRVEEAKDGLDALEKVQSGLLPKAIICDLEMPRMDGYGFLAKVKLIEEAKNIPVVMLTSRSSQKHRKIAMNLGAADYFGKPFNEADILARLAELILAYR